MAKRGGFPGGMMPGNMNNLISRKKSSLRLPEAVPWRLLSLERKK